MSMIIGIGTDIVDIRRIEKLLEEYPERFIERTFTLEEQKAADARKQGGLCAPTYARRFAAKEACAKALGAAIRDGILFTDIGVVNDEKGKPSIVLTGEAANVLARLMPDNTVPYIHLSLSDELPYAQAFVIIEAR